MRQQLCEITKRQLHITTAHQFPPFSPDLPVSKQRKDLYAGLGVIVMAFTRVATTVKLQTQ